MHASPDYLEVGRVDVRSASNYYVTHLNSPQTDANFYVVRQLSVATTSDTNFKLPVNTTLEGAIEIPKGGSITLAGRESKIIVTNYPFGNSVLSYSTAEVRKCPSYVMIMLTIGLSRS